MFFKGSGCPCWNTASQYGGKYSKDDATEKYECVQCSGAKKTKLLPRSKRLKLKKEG